ncbi:MAG TPA: YncE family protein [Gemmatimonadales bacterium]|nr:YncE family protein [Gemmatimonadales bacterium]
MKASIPGYRIERLLLAASLLVQGCGKANGQEPILTFIADVPLPGGPSRFDYQSFDPASSRLYIAHMGAGQLIAFDTRQQKVAGQVSGLPKATGVLVVPELHRVYVSAAGSRQVVVFDDSTLKRITTIDDITFPDGLAYAPSAQKIFVSDEYGHREIVIDASGHGRRTIALGGEAGNTQYDSAGKQILVAVQTSDELVAIDPNTERITGRYRLAGADYPHGLLIDSPKRLAFVANERNNKLLAVDLGTMRVLSAYQAGREPDVLAFDRELRRLYVASESGVITVFEEIERGLKLLGTYTAPQAHTVAVNPVTHEVYLPLANIGGQPVLRILRPVR